jgi:hypothetical protein
MVVLVLALAACSSRVASVGEQTVVRAAWNALEPNTSSHSRSNWEVVDVRRVEGREVAAQFEGDPAAGCWIGPTPSDNEQVTPSARYWLVHMRPVAVTPLPQTAAPSPTAPPRIPEPFIRQAYFLVEVDSGQVVARKLHCVIY